MNFYRAWKRFYIDVSWPDLWGNYGVAIGRWTPNTAIDNDDFVDDWFAPLQDDPEAHGIVHVGAQTATVTVEPLNMVNQRDEE